LRAIAVRSLFFTGQISGVDAAVKIDIIKSKASGNDPGSFVFGASRSGPFGIMQALPVLPYNEDPY